MDTTIEVSDNLYIIPGYTVDTFFALVTRPPGGYYYSACGEIYCRKENKLPAHKIIVTRLFFFYVIHEIKYTERYTCCIQNNAHIVGRKYLYVYSSAAS